jgi:pilin isopeptide linkage protein
MKKFLVTILALTFIMGMSGATFAQASDELTDQSSVPITKLFKLANQDTTSPAETFTFNIVRDSYSDSLYSSLDAVPLPQFNLGTDKGSISFDRGQATITGVPNSVFLNLPWYDHVGYYTYKLTETPGNTAGVTYDTRTLYLTVTVINKGDGLIRQVTSLYYYSDNVKLKSQNFENVFSAGNLAITKEVTGNMGEKDRYFNVTVTLNVPEGKNIATVPVSYSGGKYVGAQNVTFTDGKAVVPIDLKNDDTITFTNLPYGVTYTAVEEDVTGAGYDVAKYAFSDTNKTIDTAADTVTITNNKAKEVATGISLDNLPYIMILVIAAGGLIIFAKRKRIN